MILLDISCSLSVLATSLTPPRSTQCGLQIIHDVSGSCTYFTFMFSFSFFFVLVSRLISSPTAALKPYFNFNFRAKLGLAPNQPALKLTLSLAPNDPHSASAEITPMFNPTPAQLLLRVQLHTKQLAARDSDQLDSNSNRRDSFGLDLGLRRVRLFEEGSSTGVEAVYRRSRRGKKSVGYYLGYMVSRVPIPVGREIRIVLSKSRRGDWINREKREGRGREGMEAAALCVAVGGVCGGVCGGGGEGLWRARVDRERRAACDDDEGEGRKGKDESGYRGREWEEWIARALTPCVARRDAKLGT
ncbi:hypothetical protein DFH08DRAFT_820248 [Mycena albidolilacea]|uniref:Uncharacterized protein n=1 Tax=Mycena albidolilacea TaxID=1033008 RepID=A0AAD6ZCR8_9AGAR|nr:hypothetical protein DFH08DRAFT_820248 [Mycena albidolilacea]